MVSDGIMVQEYKIVTTEGYLLMYKKFFYLHYRGLLYIFTKKLWDKARFCINIVFKCVSVLDHYEIYFYNKDIFRSGETILFMMMMMMMQR